MERQSNTGKTRSDVVQNQFTAFLTIHLMYKRNKYIKQLHTKAYYEIANEYDQDLKIEYDYLDGLPVLMQLESDVLAKALQKLKGRERDIFLAHALDGKDFTTLAAEIGLTYKGAATLYYRVLQKLKKAMSEVKDGI